MALALDANAGAIQTGTASGASTVATGTGISTSTAGDIILAFVHAEWLLSVGANGVVSGVSGGGLTWAQAPGGAVTDLTVATGGGFACYNDAELWWAYSSGTLATQVITATFTTPGGNNFDDASIVCWAVKGFTGGSYSTNPWDSNASAIVTASSTGITSTVPTLSNLSTTATATMILGLTASPKQPEGSGQIGAGYTYIGGTNNQGGTNSSCADGEYQLVAQAETNFTVNWNGSTPGWLLIAAALAQAGGSVGDTLQSQACL